MEVSIQEFTQLQNLINESNKTSFEKGVQKEKERPLPNNLFDAFLDYAKKSKTLIDYHKSSYKEDGCFWIQVKPSRLSKGIEHIEISFAENQNEINYIGAKKKSK